MLGLESTTNDITFSFDWLLRVSHNHILSVYVMAVCQRSMLTLMT